jgi:hypothetical protein
MSADIRPDFEHYPPGEPLDETDVSLRAYVAGLPEERLAAYDPSWSDDQVMAWDGNFRSDGALMLVCCERDVDVHEFRSVLEAYRRYRQAGGAVQSPAH